MHTSVLDDRILHFNLTSQRIGYFTLFDPRCSPVIKVPLLLKARIDGEVGRKTRVLCEVYAGDVLTALGDSVFVRVDVGHLAKTAHS